MFLFQRSDSIDQVIGRLEWDVSVFLQHQRVVFDVVLFNSKFEINFRA
jgi:hypothetical protein